MSNHNIKKQLEANLVPNIWRIMKSHSEKNGPIILSFGSAIKAALTAFILTMAVSRLARLSLSMTATLVMLVIVTGVVLNFVGRKGGIPAKKYDSFGNQIDESNIYGSGRRMTREEMRRFLDIFPESDPKGTILGVYPGTGECLGIPDHDRPYHSNLDHRHILLFGASGRGKTKFLTDRHRQVLYQGFTDVYTDPKGELTENDVRPCADAMGYKNKWLIRFRTKDIHLSNRFDLLKLIRTAKYPETEANWLAGKILGYKDQFNGNDYWADSQKSLLILSLLAAARCKYYVSISTFLSTGESNGEFAETGTWKTAACVFEYTAEEVRDYFLYLRGLCEENEHLLRKHYNTWIGDERNWKGHVSSVQKKINTLAQEGVAEIFSEDEIDFDALVSEPSTLGIVYDIPPGDFSPAMNLVLQFVNAAILRNKGEHKVSIILEELKVTGVIDYLDEYFSYLRSYNTQIIGCTQSYSQLKKLYGPEDAESFFQNTHVVFVGGQEPGTLEKLEELTGTQGLKGEFTSISVGGGSVRSTERYDVIQSAVIDRTELLYMPKGKVFVKLSNCGPTILDSYNSNKHPLATVRYVDKATGRCHKLTMDELDPTFDLKERDLKIIGAPTS